MVMVAGLGIGDCSHGVAGACAASVASAAGPLQDELGSRPAASLGLGIGEMRSELPWTVHHFIGGFHLGRVSLECGDETSLIQRM